MQEITEQPTTASEATDGLSAAALRAEAWAGEPFIREGEDPARVLAPGTSRRRALDDALAEIEAGRRAPSSDWKVRYGLMLGLERVLAEERPHLASGTELRRHQVDALAGMLTELIAANEHAAEPANGSGNGAVAEAIEEDEDEPVEDSTEDVLDEEGLDDEEYTGPDPGAVRRYRFRHPTASGKTIAAAGFVEAARTLGVLILTHRRLLVSQFDRDLTTEGYGERFTPAIEGGKEPLRDGNPLTIQTYAWFARHQESISRDAYQLVICDEAHTALGEKTSKAIRSFPEPHLHRHDGDRAADREAGLGRLPGLRRRPAAPGRCTSRAHRAACATCACHPSRRSTRFRSSAATSTRRSSRRRSTTRLSTRRPHPSTASGSRTRRGSSTQPASTTPTTSPRSSAPSGLKAEAVSGRTPPVRLAETLAAYERGEINVLINAMLLAEGWNSPRATVCMHLAPTASRRVYQQRIGRIMRTHPRKEAGIVVDFVPKAATHNERVVSLHSLLDADFYREGARVTPAPRRRVQRRARRKLTPAPWLVPVTPDVRRRLAVITREWQRIDPKYLDEDEQRYWATIAGRQIRFDERAAFVEKLTARGASKACLEQFLATCAAENPNRRLRIIALSDRVSMVVERADFDDLVTLVTQAPTWEKDRMGGVRVLLRAIAEGKADAPEQILARWTWRLARASRKLQDRRASAEFPEAKRLLGALANSRGHRHEENAAKLVNAALELPLAVGAALLASAEGYTPRATQLIEAARERLGTLQEVAGALAENLPQPKVTSGRSRRRKRRKRKKTQNANQQQQQQNGQAKTEQAEAKPAAEPQRLSRSPGALRSPRRSRSRRRLKRLRRSLD